MNLAGIWNRFALCALLVLPLLSGCNSKPQESAPATANLSTSSTPATSPASGPALFREVAQEAGLNYQWQIAGKRPLNILQTIGNGGAFLDYDNDSNLDILLVGPKLALYRGDGKGHFTDITKEAGLDRLQGHFLGCAVGDYDNDGFDDVYITAYRGGVLLHNESADPKEKTATRRFVDMTAVAGLKPQPFGSSATFVDTDSDGRLDLFIGNYVKFGPDEQQLCEGTGGKGIYSACGPRFYHEEYASLYRNLGGNRFADVSRAWLSDAKGNPLTSGKVLGCTAADFEGKGRPSIALANDERQGDLLSNQKRTFENIAVSSGTAYDGSGNVHGGMGTDWGDYDNDGNLDLVVATFQHEAKSLYHNDGGFFSEVSSLVALAEKTRPYVAFGIKFFDYDNDGYLDLVIANGHVQDNIADIDKTTTYKQKTQLFRNVNGTSFEDVSEKGGTGFQKMIMGRGLAVGDYDNDGRLDVLVIDGEDVPLLLHNETPEPSSGGGHWLLCRLIGTKSNRSGIGALITAEAGGKKFLRRCATDGSYMSASDKRVPFGLGQATRATLTVTWPSGHKDTYSDVAVDRIITLTEGKSKPE